MTNIAQTWQLDYHPAICEQCDWRYLIPPTATPPTCPHCYKGPLDFVEDTADDPLYVRPPELVVPFTASQVQLEQHLTEFAGSFWLTPADLKADHLIQRLERVYLPLWLVDSEIEALWQGEAGFDYEAVTHREQYDDNRGGWHSEKITETRTRWEPRVGRLRRTYDNVAAPALEEHLTLQRELGSFDMAQVTDYAPQLVRHSSVRLPNRAPEDAWEEAKLIFQNEAKEECTVACQGDHFREFRWTPRFVSKHWTLMLQPVFITHYQDDTDQPRTVLVHGQTGRVIGEKRASMKRAWRYTAVIVGIAALILLASFVAAGIGLAAELPLFTTLAALGIFGAIIIAGAGLMPLLFAWQFNRSQQNSKK